MKHATPRQTEQHMTDDRRTFDASALDAMLAIKQMRNASANMSKAALERTHSPEWKLSILLSVLANSAEFWGTTNRPQVERAMKDYFIAAMDRKYRLERQSGETK
jgi:hypothetical protein